MQLRRVAALAIGLALAGCTTELALEGEVISNPAVAPVNVDPADAARLLNQVRSSEGLSPVVVSPTLNAIAQGYADVLARAGVVSHTIDGVFADRLRAGGYVWVVAGENLGGGYRTLEEAFQRWRASPSHNANLLTPEIDEIGIATAFNVESPYRTFWVLIVGRSQPLR
ncbi:MAG: CAP domain-containing protein [Alphaproteobacteria bacterium]